MLSKDRIILKKNKKAMMTGDSERTAYSVAEKNALCTMKDMMGSQESK